MPPKTSHARPVTSDSNAFFKTCRQLLSGRGIRKAGHALVSGGRIVDEILAKFPGVATAWLTLPDGPPPPAEPRLDWYALARPLFDELDVAGTGTPILVVKVPEFPIWEPGGTWPAGCTLIVPFQNPDNVGAVLRSAAAFRVARVVLTEEAAHPFHPKSARSAGPALFQVPLLWGPPIQAVDLAEPPLFTLSGEGRDISSASFPATFALLPGVEGPGLPARLRGANCLSIPISGEVESLNAAAATAIALYAWRRAAPLS